MNASSVIHQNDVGHTNVHTAQIQSLKETGHPAGFSFNLSAKACASSACLSKFEFFNSPWPTGFLLYPQQLTFLPV